MTQPLETEPVLALALELVPSLELQGLGLVSQDNQISPPSFPLALQDPTPSTRTDSSWYVRVTREHQGGSKPLLFRLLSAGPL